MTWCSPAVSLGPHVVGPGGPPVLVAEAGINHNGSLDTALELIGAAGACGAQAVKFQTFRADSFISDGEAVFTYHTAQGPRQEKSLDLFRRTELDYSWHSRLFAAAREAGVLLFSTPCDQEAVDLLEALDAPLFKISSDYLTHHDFLQYVAHKGRPLIVSTGMAGLGDIEEALAAIVATGNRQVVLLHCVSAYPTPPAEVNLRAMETLRQAFGCPVGFSDHTEGIAIPLAAAALGAVLIEKHFTLDQQDCQGPDHWFSADPGELRALAEGLRLVHQALGDGRKRVAPSERDSWLHARMSVVATRDLPAGATLTADMLAVKRPGAGIPPKELGKLVGQVALQPLKQNQVLQWEQLGRPAGQR